MRTIAALLSVLGLLAPTAGADVRFYFTSSVDAAGLADTTHVFDDTDGSETDGTSYELNGETPEVGVPTLDPTKGEFLYVWVEFEGEKDKRKIQGINVALNDRAFNGFEAEVDRGVYLGDDQGGSGDKLRWELGSKTSDFVTLVAVTTPGIVNATENGWLYMGSKDGRRIALLGAVQPGAPEGESYELRLGIGANGVSYASNSDGQRSPLVKLGANEETFGGIWDDFRWSSDADAIVVPEPGNAGLLAIATALTGVARRRN